jgi:hypothetical protein
MSINRLSRGGSVNTRLARQKLVELYPHIINLQDPCHKLSLAVKSIGKLPEFQPVRIASKIRKTPN